MVIRKFPCDMCGLCCQQVGRSEIYKHLDRGDGICKYYQTETHKCSIYLQRPIICNVDAYYEKYLKGVCSKREYYKKNQYACEELKRRFAERKDDKNGSISTDSR